MNYEPKDFKKWRLFLIVTFCVNIYTVIWLGNYWMLEGWEWIVSPFLVYALSVCNMLLPWVFCHQRVINEEEATGIARNAITAGYLCELDGYPIVFDKIRDMGKRCYLIMDYGCEGYVVK